MRDPFWLTDEQMTRLRLFFPKSHGQPRADDRRVLRGMMFINRNSLWWSDAPTEYGPAKTLYSRWKRWGDMGVFARIMEGLASEAAVPKTVMIDATCPLPGRGLFANRERVKAHRTASSHGLKKGGSMTVGAV